MRLFASHTSKSMMPSFVLITTLEYSLPVQGWLKTGRGRQGQVSVFLPVYMPSVGMVIVETSLISAFGPYFGCVCNRTTGGSSCRRPTTDTATLEANGMTRTSLCEAHQSPNQRPLSHRCEHRHAARRSEYKEG